MKWWLCLRKESVMWYQHLEMKNVKRESRREPTRFSSQALTIHEH